jgi:hypothetical protein
MDVLPATCEAHTTMAPSRFKFRMNNFPRRPPGTINLGRVTLVVCRLPCPAPQESGTTGVHSSDISRIHARIPRVPR